ncbi:hypothetical protein [Enterococcus sp. CSURQ0835]|uniref:hypothetical protein n=1 Tax=Enterococcus sp. CSURQ0835 TaxID=2681394 RepID=UPI001359341B|nr:hypothetical protein [Enterococcus sp. CSURQ0835]
MKTIIQYAHRESKVKFFISVVKLLDKRWAICSAEKLSLDIAEMKQLVLSDEQAWFWKEMLPIAENRKKLHPSANESSPEK